MKKPMNPRKSNLLWNRRKRIAVSFLLLFAFGLLPFLLGAMSPGKDNDWRQDWIEMVDSMSPAEKEQLKRQWEWLRSNEADKQRHELKNLDFAIRVGAQGDYYRKVLDNYATWFDDLPFDEQRKLMDLPPQLRAERAIELRKEQMQREHDAQMLSEEELKAIVESFVEKGRELSKTGPRIFQQQQGRRVRGFQEYFSRKLEEEAEGKHSPDHFRRMFAFSAKEWGPGDVSIIRVIMGAVQDDPSFWKSTIDKLTPKTQETLADQGNLEQQANLLRTWMRATVEEYWTERRDEFSQKPFDLLRGYYEELTEEERERLDSLPPEDVFQVLPRLIQERDPDRRTFGHPFFSNNRNNRRAGPPPPNGRDPFDGPPRRGPGMNRPPGGPGPPDLFPGPDDPPEDRTPLPRT
ncbi:Hypothetical protein PBC10988_10790 [Planctomycetales bacterium 10988]|nr:Hypothetical protein PBC10988_10790 [Planctomycetales bacterium 10988]